MKLHLISIAGFLASVSDTNAFTGPVRLKNAPSIVSTSKSVSLFPQSRSGSSRLQPLSATALSPPEDSSSGGGGPDYAYGYGKANEYDIERLKKLFDKKD